MNRRCLPLLLFVVTALVHHPIRASAAPQLRIEKDNGDLRFSWPDEGPGKVYTLQHVQDLNRPYWTPLLPWDDWPIGQTSFLESLPADPHGFFRLAVTERGRVLASVSEGAAITAAYINQWLLPLIEQQYGIQLPFNASYDVEGYKIQYETLDGLLGPTTASGALFIPLNPPAGADLLSYQHGTIHKRDEAPSGSTALERFIGVIMASHGYVVAMPDYLGLGPGSTGLHPYVHRRSSATAVIDMLRAVRTLVTTDPGFQARLPHGLSEKLFLFGYSQGAFVTMAAQKEMQEKHPGEFNVTASAPSDGPYDLSGTMVEIMTSTTPYPSPNYLPYVLLSYNQIYHLFEDPAEVMVEPYASELPLLFDGEHTGGQIDAAMPPSGIPSEILQPDYLQAFSSDPNHPFRLILKDNDVTGWAPASPTRLYHCASDDIVPVENSLVAYDSFVAAGADTNIVKLIDPDSSGLHATCIYSVIPEVIDWFESLRAPP